MITTNKILNINKLTLYIQQKTILKNINLTINSNEIHILMGPNGSGKTSLTKFLIGHPNYQNYTGSVKFLGKNLNTMSPEKRSQKGIFLAFQYPPEISQLTNLNLLQTIYSLREKNITNFISTIKPYYNQLFLDEKFLHRNFNENFSGGEKKKNEILQMCLLKPKLIILDEIDSGVDISSIEMLFNIILKYKLPETSLLIITHNTKFLYTLNLTKLHLLINGQMLTYDFPYKILKELDQFGFEYLKKKEQNNKNMNKYLEQKLKTIRRLGSFSIFTNQILKNRLFLFYPIITKIRFKVLQRLKLKKYINHQYIITNLLKKYINNIKHKYIITNLVILSICLVIQNMITYEDRIKDCEKIVENILENLHKYEQEIEGDALCYDYDAHNKEYEKFLKQRKYDQEIEGDAPNDEVDEEYEKFLKQRKYDQEIEGDAPNDEMDEEYEKFLEQRKYDQEIEGDAPNDEVDEEMEDSVAKHSFEYYLYKFFAENPFDRLSTAICENSRPGEELYTCEDFYDLMYRRTPIKPIYKVSFRKKN